jgi:hypothetical protein
MLALITFNAVALFACQPTVQKSGDTTTPTALQTVAIDTAAAQRVDTTAVVVADSLSPAYRQLARFLSLAVATRVLHTGIADSVYTTGTEPDINELYTDMRWVADFRILSVSTRGDSGRATAVVTDVARQVEKRGTYEATYGIREDTAHWLLVRGLDSTGRWLVNGDAAEGFGVFHVGRQIRWVSGSRGKALAAVDSIRRARGFPLIR